MSVVAENDVIMLVVFHVISGVMSIFRIVNSIRKMLMNSM